MCQICPAWRLGFRQQMPVQVGGSVSAFVINQCNCDCQCIQAAVSLADPIISCPGPRSTRPDKYVPAASSLEPPQLGRICGQLTVMRSRSRTMAPLDAIAIAERAGVILGGGSMWLIGPG
jgi:hypothetical protein